MMDDDGAEQAGRASARYFVHRMPANVLGLAALVLVARWLASPESLEGDALGLSARTWWSLALGVPIVHQAFVWCLWRAELCWGALSRRWGAERAFAGFRAGFFPLLLARPVVIAGLAWADRGSWREPDWLTAALAMALFIPAAWAIHSVDRYFGPYRAAGADHFIARYRSMPFERRGAFQYVPNAMYTLVFLLFWAIAAALGSRAGLVAAGFAHAYIWLHYVTLERPDMDIIYGGGLTRLRRG